MAMVTRRGWNARAPRSSIYLASTRGVKAHYTGGRVDPATLTNHARCLEAIRGIQLGHMNGNGWSDIGYSMWCCNHAFGVGRGPHVLPAANGPGLNSAHYAILFLVGNAGVTEPTDAMKRNFHAARDYLREKGNAGAEIKGHRDGYATDCPGGPIYRWVRAGAPRPKADKPEPTPKPEPTQEDEMPVRVSLGLTDEVEIPKDFEYAPWWTQEWSDPNGWHPAGGQSIAPDEDVWTDAVALVKLRGLAPGETVSVGMIRTLSDGTKHDDAWGPVVYRADQDGRVEASINGHFKLSAVHRGRVAIRHSSANTVTMEAGATGSMFKAIMHPYA